MSRIAVAAAVLVVGWSAATAVAHADPTPAPPPPGPALGPPPGPAPEAAPGPKTTIDGDGTYAVGTDIAPGAYQSAGPIDDGACYWKRVNGSGIVDNALSKKAQFVQIDPGDTAFTTSDCQPWEKTDAAPPPRPGPATCSASWAVSSVAEF